MARKKTKRKVRKVRKVMAKRRTRVIYRARKATRRARGGGGTSGFKPVIDGFLAGIGGAAINKFLPQAKGLGQPIAAIGVGVFRKNPVLKIEGSRELGAYVGAMLLGGNGGGAYGGGGGY